MYGHGAGMAVVLFVAAPMWLPAQAPRVTPDGDPSVSNDSIYALVVDPSEYRGNDVVVLLDDGIVRVESDGRSTVTYRQVVQILTTGGTESWGEAAFRYNPERQRFRLNWWRVVAADGTVVSEGPEHEQESAVSVDARSPVYSDQKLIRMTIAGVVPGTIVDLSYTIETFAPRVAGDFWHYWGVNGINHVLRSRYIVDSPKDVAIKLREANLHFDADMEEVEGRIVRRWVTRDIPGVQVQSYAGWPNDVVMSVSFSGDLTWKDIGAWYYPLVEGRYRLSQEIIEAHEAELSGASTLTDSVEATYRWVAQDFRYVSLSLGAGAYRPRTPAEVYQSGFGDCKDKAVLFLSLMRRMGLNAYPVLVNLEGGVDSLAPSIKQFDHMVATVEGVPGARYFDLTSRFTPYGEVPYYLQGEVGVVLRDDVSADVVVFPAANPEENRSAISVVGDLRLDNSFTGSVTFEMTGSEQYTMREQFADVHQLSEIDRDELLRRYAHAIVWENAVVDSSQVFEGLNLNTPARVRIWFTSEGLLGQVGKQYTLHIPVIDFGDPSAVQTLDAEGERLFPIDVAQVNSPSVYRSYFEARLPKGWRADLPAPVRVEGSFGYYRSDYRQIGRKIAMSREMGGTRGLLPPDSVAALRQWLTSVADDDPNLVSINPNGSPGLRAEGELMAGRFPDIIPTVSTLPDGATLSSEGVEHASGSFDFLAADPLESYSRSSNASQKLLSFGESAVAYLTVTGSAYHTADEADKSRQAFELMDIGTLLEGAIGEFGIVEAKVGASRSLDSAVLGEHASGVVVELESPMFALDMAFMVLRRGRVAVSMMALGPKGMKAEDLAILLQLIDDPIRQDAEYMEDLPDEAWEAPDRKIAEWSVVDSLGINLDQVVLMPKDLPGSKIDSRGVDRSAFWDRFEVTLDGRAITFATPTSEAVNVTTRVVRYQSAAAALKALLRSEGSETRGFVEELLVEDGTLVDPILADSSVSMMLPATRAVGTRSLARSVAIRRGFRFDVDAVDFVRGPYLVTLEIWSLPGGGAPDDAAALAQRVDFRLRELIPELADTTISQELLRQVETVIYTEDVVDSLVDARDFDGVFTAIDGAGLARSPVSLSPGTWNQVCWYAALFGHAKRAIASCEAAVQPDSTNLAIRDSRAVARAIAGDREGAIADLRYLVENTEQGPWIERRLGWLESLQNGQNPFTEEEVMDLRGDGEE